MVTMMNVLVVMTIKPKKENIVVIVIVYVHIVQMIIIQKVCLIGVLVAIIRRIQNK